MKRLAALCLASLFLMIAPAMTAPVAWAQNPTPTATAVPRGTIISLPANNETVRGRVRVFGSAWVENFQRYEVYYISGAQQVYMGGGSQPVINGLIYEWNTAGFKDGVYGLMVRSVRLDGNYTEVKISVRVDNAAPPTPTPSPVPAGTPTIEPTRTPLAIPSTPVVLRTATPTPASAATPTGTGGLLTGLPIPDVDPMACLRPMMTGAALAGAFFLLFGLLAIIKRLLGG